MLHTLPALSSLFFSALQKNQAGIRSQSDGFNSLSFIPTVQEFDATMLNSYSTARLKKSLFCHILTTHGRRISTIFRSQTLHPDIYRDSVTPFGVTSPGLPTPL